MKIDRRSAINTKPYSFDEGPLNLVIKVNEGETVLRQRAFFDKEKAGEFTKWENSADDCLKLIGYGTDGIIYVTEKINMNLTDEEFAEWVKRTGTTSEAYVDPEYDKYFGPGKEYYSSSRGYVHG